MKLAAIILFFSIVVFPQQGEKITAKIGNISITGNEFLARYELVPRINAAVNIQGDGDKLNFLYGLITEKLLSLGAVENKLDTVDIVKHTLHNYEKMFVRDALYKKEVKEKSKLYAEELLSFYLSGSSVIFTRFIVSKDEEKIKNIHSLIVKGLPFDSVYNELTVYEKDTATIHAGALDELNERALFSLPEGGVSEPLKINDGVYLFRVDKKSEPVKLKPTGWETEYRQLEKTARKKAEDKFYQKYISQFFKNQKVEANGFLIKSLAEKFSALFEQKKKLQKENSKLFLATTDIVNIESLYSSDSLNLPFIKLNNGAIPFREFIRWFRFENFSSDKSDFITIASMINARSKKFVEQELFYQQGIKEGLDKDPSVQRDIAMWRDNYLSQIMSSSFKDSISISNLNTSVTSDSNTDETAMLVNIIEVEVDSLDNIETILDEIKSGTDMHQIAAKYNSQQNTGESGMQLSSTLGEIGRIAASMQVGEIYGPLQIEDGYSIFKLIDKQKPSDSLMTNPLSPQLKTNTYHKQVRDKLAAYVSSLAERYGVEINKDLLSQINPTKITSVVFRRLGFGGKITAVPFNMSDIEWTRQLKKKDDL